MKSSLEKLYEILYRTKDKSGNRLTTKSWSQFESSFIGSPSYRNKVYDVVTGRTEGFSDILFDKSKEAFLNIYSPEKHIKKYSISKLVKS